MKIGIGLVFLLIHISIAWKRSALIYNIPNRSATQWERHLMRVNSAGAYTGQWLFDAAILTCESVNGKGVYVAGGFTGQDYMDYLDLVFSYAVELDRAYKSLASSWPPPSVPMEIFIGIPYPNPNNRHVAVDGKVFDLGVPSQRLDFGYWYAEKVIAMSKSRSWYNFHFGIYYHLEEAVEMNGDPQFLVKFNAHAHSLGLKTLWVPFYDASGAWNGTSMGFDFLSIQPRFSFQNPIDAGSLKGDRLHSTGYKAASGGHALEYELRGQGESELEYSIAHQYLAVSQLTGNEDYTQVFFVGGPDIFDRVSDEASAPTRFMWMAYQDLGNYLRGDRIPNWEVEIPWNPILVHALAQEITWTSTVENLNSIRLDFSDFNLENPWRGGMRVIASGYTSSTLRIGPDSLDPTYNSVFVPFSNIPTFNGTQIRIQISREMNSPWPRAIRLVAAKFEPKYVANSIYGEASSSSNLIQQMPGIHTDSSLTHFENGGTGKLTDGKQSPNGEWWLGNGVGWNLNENVFTISIDLGASTSIGGIKVSTYKHLSAGVQWPEKIGGFVGLDCVPAERSNCQAVATLGRVTIDEKLWPGSDGRYSGTLTSKFGGAVSGRYVTITGTCRGWCILDEVEVIDGGGRVVSTGKNYRVTPAPGEYDKGVTYGDNSQLLVDGAIFSDWIPGNLNSVGLLLKNNSHFVQAVWSVPRSNPIFGSIWVTKARLGWGISLPPSVKIQWRNERGIWTSGTDMPFIEDCGGGSPCARLRFPFGSRVTGIKGTFPATQMWVMVTEISIL